MAGKRRSQRGQSRESVSETAGAREPQKSEIGGPCQEPSSMVNHRGQQSLPMGGEGQTNSVLPVQEALVALSAVYDEQKPVDGRARALAYARAANVDSTVRSARVALIVDLFRQQLWEPGVTAWELARVWTNLKGETIENDASLARLVLEVSTDKSAVAPRFWASSFALLERAESALGKAESVFDRYCGDASMPSPDEVMALSSALGRFSDSASKLLEMMGRAGGLIQSGSKVDVRVDVLDPGERKPRKVDPAEVANAWSRAQSFFVEAHPELLQEFLAYCGTIDTVGEDVPTMGQGG